MGQQTQELNADQKAIYDNIMLSLKSDAKLASDYSNRKCGRCTGKGYYDMDRGSILSVTTKLCGCIDKKLKQEIIKVV